MARNIMTGECDAATEATIPPADRCHTCDRPFAGPSDSWPNERLCFRHRQGTLMLIGETNDCRAHAVNWRERALKAEARYEPTHTRDLERFLSDYERLKAERDAFLEQLKAAMRGDPHG